MLVDQEDGDIFALCEILERGFDDACLCFWTRSVSPVV
jgi:hypothetical protein